MNLLHPFFWDTVILDIQREREKDPYRRTNHHGKEQEDQLKAVPGPAQTSSPQLVQVRLNLNNRIDHFDLLLS